MLHVYTLTNDTEHRNKCISNMEGESTSNVQEWVKVEFYVRGVTLKDEFLWQNNAT